MKLGLFYMDDLVTESDQPRNAEALREWLRTNASPLPQLTKSGEYRNRLGERVTWEASEGGSYVTLHTEWTDRDDVSWVDAVMPGTERE